jgi:nitrate reductase gamma subunit
MNRSYIVSLIAVFVLFLAAYVGAMAPGLQLFFGVLVPYAALLIFLWGFFAKLMGWARSAVPFRIPTTCGQQKSLPWVKPNPIDNPFSGGAVIIRMALEVLFFRSLFRNTRAAFHKEGKISYHLEIFLWLGALVFHYAFLTVLIRHLRFFMEPVPFFIKLLEAVDGFMQFGLPIVYLSGVGLLAGVLYLLSRRIFIAKVRYISLAADYFPLFLIGGIAITGIMMRYFTKVDIVAIKELTMGLVTFSPTIPEGISRAAPTGWMDTPWISARGCTATPPTQKCRNPGAAQRQTLESPGR